MSSRTITGALAITALTALPLPALVVPAHAANSFEGFAGTWRGTGAITMTSGTQEKIRCRGTYAVRADQQALNIDLLCASDSYKVNISSNLVAQGATITGTWQETTRQVQGTVTGTLVGPGQMQANLEGLGFGMQFSARVSGRRQLVVLQASGTEVQSVDITLKR